MKKKNKNSRIEKGCLRNSSKDWNHGGDGVYVDNDKIVGNLKKLRVNQTFTLITVNMK